MSLLSYSFSGVVVGVCLLVAPLVASAQETAIIKRLPFRLGVEAEPKFGLAGLHFSLEAQATKRIGIRVQRINYAANESGVKRSSRGFELSATYYTRGFTKTVSFIKPSTYLTAFVERSTWTYSQNSTYDTVVRREEDRIFFEEMVTVSEELTGAGKVWIVGFIAGRRWQSDNWYLRAGVGSQTGAATQLEWVTNSGQTTTSVVLKPRSVAVDLTIGYVF